MVPTASSIAAAQVRGMISEDLWQRLVSRLMEREGCDRRLAESMMEATLGFLKLCADHPGRAFAPSNAVDVGWHTFLLYTREYREFCEAYAGCFIDHEPEDSPRASSDTDLVSETVAFMRRHGVQFDDGMWLTRNAGSDCRTGQPSPCARTAGSRPVSAAHAR